MNVVFFLLLTLSIIALTIISPSTILSTMIGGVSNATSLIFKLLAVYSVWLSVLNMVQKTGIDKYLTRMLKPIIRKIFKRESDETYNWIALNISADMLGMGGVATKAGIKAIESMKGDVDRATDNMILMLVVNATTIQIVPSTIIAIRASHGAINASDTYLPTLVATVVSAIVGVAICKILSSFKRKNKSNDNDNKNILSIQNDSIKPVYCNLKGFANKRKMMR